jgi:hypothetical protein
MIKRLGCFDIWYEGSGQFGNLSPIRKKIFVWAEEGRAFWRVHIVLTDTKPEKPAGNKICPIFAGPLPNF